MKPHPALKTLFWLVFLALAAEAVSVFFWGDQFATQFSEGFHPDAAFERSGAAVRVREHTARNMWPQEIAVPKPAGVKRVIIIGDSVARGGSLRGSYAFMAAEIYNRKVKTGPRVEGFNLSASGYGVRRKDALLQKALTLEPDLVAVCLGGTNEMEDERHWDRARRFDDWKSPFLWPLKLRHVRFLVNRRTEELVWRYIPLEIRKKIIPDDIEAEVMRDPPEEREQRWRDRLSDGIARLVDRAWRAKVPLVVMVRAVFDAEATATAGTVQPPDLADDMTLFLLGEVEKHRDKLLAAIPYGRVFKTATTGPGEYRGLFIDTRHFTEKGHEIAAEFLADEVLIPLFSDGAR
ncbi:MAG: SGNH/GDSL hydrolase family protein [Pseudomonadota bacterium]